uniref:ATP synthase complex subunit 8 n=1 Tax=Kalotermitidae sp. 5 AB-2022a TaxID=2942737 RepID=A0A8X8M281_9NEOP|nr:ATP synthase F0 subunit 8 [Kalotermitidae sp. 5 AB-2022a]
MPQMMPLSWLTLFITFSATLIVFTSMNYYLHIPKPSTTKTLTTDKNPASWKW